MTKTSNRLSQEARYQRSLKAAQEQVLVKLSHAAAERAWIHRWVLSLAIRNTKP